MRLSTRSNVDLPQPDGPIMPVTWRSGRLRLTPFRAHKNLPAGSISMNLRR